ncbi:NAD(P)/FAD-dependent oxidoreductase [Nocardioides panzhihuensis]|uniref:NADH dehydrogenase FAD-containing subunit n=1 Tax=Nocardioides panzhihuensis TaxID=860243 RepID=A0A7Z0IRJ5_9ACTN|nr:FAD-dependent oxidoreductase [Nocardioides panzhihuensis]NYI76777.1 NADH dehydrogenase FAD-containing subunit [Nocardioides panzhihuensis]
MKHRIVVLGAGYAGAFTAGNLVRRLSPADTEVTVINAEEDFVQRLRMHQLAAGQEIDSPALADVFAGTGIRLRVARVTALDPERRIVTVADADGGGEIGYDTLLYAMGSAVADNGVPGIAEHAFHVTSRPAALYLRERLDELGEGGRVVVVGDGWTGIESAAEFAESRPNLSVTLVARGELGARLSPGGRRHLRRTCERLGITIVEHTTIEAVEATRVIATDGTVIASDATVWTGGFSVNPIAAASGVQVAATGQIVVDRTMRSVSHPDVYAAGDSVYAIGDNGLPLPMSCASAGYTGGQALDAIVGRLTGRKIAHTKLVYPGNHISLGRKDGILQTVDATGHPKPKYMGGRRAARIKAGIVTISLWAVSHPTFGMPKRRRRLTPAANASSRGDDRAAV